MLEIFVRFLILGCMSFGGPVAHIGYFQREFVVKRKWIEEEQFTVALSLCQFLPGPASSQLGMFIGYHRGGYLGAILAFVGFTFPSFALLTAAAIYKTQWGDLTAVTLFITAAKLLAVVVVADAIWNMSRQFITDIFTFGVCVLSAAWILWQTSLFAQLFPIVIAGVLGWLFFSNKKTSNIIKEERKPADLKQSCLFFGLFLALLILPAFIHNPFLNLFQHFYQAGSLVFGGGHVVLPLLQPLIGNSVADPVLVEGYAAAQLVPGPMFTIASFIGASVEGIPPLLGSVIATLAIFLPGALILFAVLPIWQRVMDHRQFSGSIFLINAAVVGLLLAAFYQPIWVSAIKDFYDIVAVLMAFIVLRMFRISVFSLLAGLLIYVFLKPLF